MKIDSSCDHEWITLRGAIPLVGQNQGGQMGPAVFKCNKCGLIMLASEVLQLVALENQTKEIQRLKTFYKITIFISAIALIISVIGWIV